MSLHTFSTLMFACDRVEKARLDLEVYPVREDIPDLLGLKAETD